MEPERQTDIYGRVLGQAIPALILPIVAVALRFWARLVIPPDDLTPRVWWDDLIALFTLPFAIAMSISSILWARLDLGQHYWIIPFDRIVDNMKYVQLQIYLWNVGVTFANFSVIFFYARVFTKINKKFKYGLWIVGALNFGWWQAAFWSAIFQCWPIQSAWNIFDPRRHCLDYWPWFLSIGGANVAIDALILLLPLPVLFGLQIPFTRKVLVLVVFTCGGAVLACAITRQVILVNLGPHFIYDPMYNILPMGRIVGIEAPICLVAGSMPVIFSLMMKGLKHGPRSLFSTKTPSTAPLAGNMNDDASSWYRRPGSRLSNKELPTSDEDLGWFLNRESTIAEERPSFQACYSTTIGRGSPYPGSRPDEELGQGETSLSRGIHIKKVFDLSSEQGSVSATPATAKDLDDTYHRSWYLKAHNGGEDF